MKPNHVKEDKKVEYVQKKSRSAAYFTSSQVGSPTSSSVQGSEPSLSGGAFSFGLAGSLVQLHRRLFAGILFPLVTVVDSSGAQETGKLIQDLCVVFNQLCH